MEIIEQLKNAKLASRSLISVSKEDKEKALLNISEALINNQDYIIEENKKDIKNARENKMIESMVDRLLLDETRIHQMANDIKNIISLDDPINEAIEEIKRPNGLLIKKVRIPLGVIGVIYESRPNVTVDIATLCIKTNNVCVLKGGKEAINSNTALMKVMQDAVKGIIPDNSINLLVTKERADTKVMMEAHDYIDVLIPRGSKTLIDFVVDNAKVPIIETGAGICHLYVDKDADIDMAVNIAKNAKIQRPSVCNAIETILIHQDVKKEFLLKLEKEFNNQVEFYGDEQVQEIISCKHATEKNYATEYDDYICNLHVVSNIDEAIEHIYKYSTKHSESIITKNDETAKYFMDSLDSACVYHNASTRFSDGGEFGFGAEVGISTQKLHARGPLGLKEITSTKYLIEGNGQIRR